MFNQIAEMRKQRVRHMTDMDAIMTIECDDNATDYQIVAAYQHLIDSGLVWQLQGSYGRMASYLIEAGICCGVEVD